MFSISKSEKSSQLLGFIPQYQNARYFWLARAEELLLLLPDIESYHHLLLRIKLAKQGVD